MTRLFIGLYIGVLAVLFAAWYIHGIVLTQRSEADLARVIETAHGGGARLVASELDAAPPESQVQTLNRLRERFDYPVSIIARTDLPSGIQRRLATGADVSYFSPREKAFVVVAILSNKSEVVRLGPFPNYELIEIENSIGGWLRLASVKLESVSLENRTAVLEEIQQKFEFPIEMAKRRELPSGTQERLGKGTEVVFFRQGDDRWFAATPLTGGTEVVRCGPFPSFERIEQKAAATTLAFVLLPVALAIALLLRPVVLQLRRVEHAAKSIAEGDLSARVDEHRVRAAKPLAEAFNNMANRTETVVRTQRELLQAVSHELRTPLSRMRFAIDLIETAHDDAERKQRLESLDAATEELDGLVGELLSYVQMETAEPHLNCEDIALDQTLGVLLPKYEGLYPEVEFRADDNPAETLVSADRSAFQRAIGNLVSNAGRFAKSRVTVTAESNGKSISINVDDDGKGIAEADRQRVFEPFVRLDDDANGQGAGLGLALVRRIVSRHGGSVEVQTSPLGGCRITTIWPKPAALEAE
ncbi:MAG: HAMP domain-containing protein [Planctomycetes bacterium]|nr:HAMP domain-containing protein [Planctomycetota bacterium]